MSILNTLEKYSLWIGVGAMIIAIIAILLEAGSLLQKSLFMIASLTLTFVAYLSKQKMFLVLQIVVVVGALLAFFTIPQDLKYTLLVGVAISGIIYLVKINYFKKDKWCPIGIVGILAIATAFAMSATNLLIFYSLLVAGAILIAIYSALQFFLLKIKIAFIWLVLNIIFSIGPLLFIISLLS